MVQRRIRRRPMRSMKMMESTVKTQFVTATTVPTAMGLEKPTMSKSVLESDDTTVSIGFMK